MLVFFLSVHYLIIIRSRSVLIMCVHVMVVSEGQLALEFPGDGDLIPVVPSEVSGTALAAALLRDGWSVSDILGLTSSHHKFYAFTVALWK